MGDARTVGGWGLGVGATLNRAMGVFLAPFSFESTPTTRAIGLYSSKSRL